MSYTENMPAFPMAAHYRPTDGFLMAAECYGLTKREFIAAMAMQGQLANAYAKIQDGVLVGLSDEVLAKNSVEYADALLAELDKPCEASK